jgi:disulfide bond formation protein DsbB
MTEPAEREVRKTARGRDEATPARVLFGVALTVWAAAAVFAAVLLLVWWLVAR